MLSLKRFSVFFTLIVTLFYLVVFIIPRREIASYFFYSVPVAFFLFILFIVFKNTLSSNTENTIGNTSVNGGQDRIHPKKKFNQKTESSVQFRALKIVLVVVSLLIPILSFFRLSAPNMETDDSPTIEINLGNSDYVGDIEPNATSEISYNIDTIKWNAAKDTLVIIPTRDSTEYGEISEINVSNAAGVDVSSLPKTVLLQKPQVEKNVLFPSILFLCISIIVVGCISFLIVKHLQVVPKDFIDQIKVIPIVTPVVCIGTPFLGKETIDALHVTASQKTLIIALSYCCGLVFLFGMFCYAIGNSVKIDGKKKLQERKRRTRSLLYKFALGQMLIGFGVILFVLMYVGYFAF